MKNVNILILSINHLWFDNRVYFKVVKSLCKKKNVNIRIVTANRYTSDDLICEESVSYEFYDRPKSIIGTTRLLVNIGVSYMADIVICIEPITLLAGYILKKRLKCRFVYDCHEFFADAFREKRKGLAFLYWQYEKHLASRTDAIITVNDILVKRLSEASPDVFLCANLPVMDDIHRGTHRQATKRYDLIYAGSISFERGIKVYLETAKLFKVNKTPFSFLIIGSFKNSITEKYFFDFIEKYDIASHITYKPFMPYQSVLDEISSAKVGIFFGDGEQSPRYHNAIPVKIYDFMSQSVPVIVNRLDMVSRFVEAANCGWVLDYDHQALYDFLSSMLSATDEMEKRGKAGWEYIHSYLSWEKQERDLFLAVFGELS
jgi:hypothetical protein